MTQLPLAITVAGLGLASVWLLAILARATRTVGFALASIFAVGLWDVFAAFDMIPLLGLFLLVNLLVLMAASRPSARLTTPDAAATMLILASVFPPMVSGRLDLIPGIVVVIGGTYLTGRVAQPSWGLIRNTALAIGAGHSLVAMLSLFPAAAVLIPSLPNQVVTWRADGLYANPNTLGSMLAMTIALSLWLGFPRRLVPLLLICGVGLLLTGSRAAVIGLVVALAVVALKRRRGTLVGVTLLGIATLTALVAIPVPGTLDRFDPLNYGTDPGLLDRFSSWQRAILLFQFSPIFGHGVLPPYLVVDMMYLGWLVTGGLFGAALWLLAAGLLASSVRALPVFAVVLVAGFLSNPLAGAPLMLLLLLLGAEWTGQGALHPTRKHEPAAAPSALRNARVP